MRCQSKGVGGQRRQPCSAALENIIYRREKSKFRCIFELNAARVDENHNLRKGGDRCTDPGVRGLEKVVQPFEN